MQLQWAGDPATYLQLCCQAGAEESYEESAEREIQEEMGVSQVELKTCFDFYHADETSRLWGRLFTCTYDGGFTLDPEEVESGDFMSVQVVAHHRPSLWLYVFLHSSTGGSSKQCICARPSLRCQGHRNSALTHLLMFPMQEVKQLLSKGQVPPDSKACLDKYLAKQVSDC